ncbi:ChuT ABC-type hemin transport system, periplasmic component [Candidatus Nanopelagicaceae bacterium]
MRIRVFAVVLVTAFALSGCSQQSSHVIEIQAGDVVTSRVVANETPRYSRVIALANGSAEIIDSLGLKEILIGRDIASTEPALKSIPIVTSGHQVVAEKILALNPDLVIIDASVGPTSAIETLKKSNINVELINEVWTVDAISQKVEDLADVLGVPATGAALVKKLESTTDSASQQVEGSPKVLFLYLRGGNSIYLVGGKGSGADSLFSSIGAIDVGAQNSAKPFASLTAESLISMNPDVIVVMIKGLESVGGASGLINLPGVAQTSAGKLSRVIAVDDSLLLSFGTRTPSLLSKLALAFNEVRR